MITERLPVSDCPISEKQAHYGAPFQQLEGSVSDFTIVNWWGLIKVDQCNLVSEINVCERQKSYWENDRED